MYKKSNLVKILFGSSGMSFHAAKTLAGVPS
jgi:hypothetical protein